MANGGAVNGGANVSTPLGVAMLIMLLTTFARVIVYLRSIGLSTALRSMLPECRRAGQKVDEADEATLHLRKKEAELLDTWNVATARVMAKCGWMVGMSLCVTTSLEICKGSWIPAMMGVCYFVGLTTLFLSGLFPGIVTSRTLVFWHTSLMVTVSIWSFVEVPTQARPATNAASSALCILFAGFCLRLRVLVVTNILYTACICWATARRLWPQDDVALRFTVGAEVVQLVVRLAIFYAVDNLRTQCARGEVNARFKKCTETAVSSLLNMVCDCMVDLDESLCMKCHFDKFAGMLMHRRHKSLQGCAFTHFIPEGDEQDRFKAIIGEVHENGEHVPNMTTLRLRDSIGNSIKVVAFHVPYTSIMGSTHHLIGLAEDSSDGQRAGAGAFEVDVRRRRHSVADAAADPEPVDCVSAASHANVSRVNHDNNAKKPSARLSHLSSRSSGSSSNRSGSQASDSKKKRKGRTFEVYVDSGLPMRSVARWLQEEFGFKTGMAFQDLISVDAASKLHVWLQTVANDAFHRGCDGGFEMQFGDVDIKKANPEANEQVRVSASVYFPSPIIPEDGSQQFVSITLAGKSTRRQRSPQGTAAVSDRQALRDGPTRPSRILTQSL